MSGNDNASKTAFVPLSFDDLKRSAQTRRPVPPLATARESTDIATLSVNQGFMKQHKAVLYVALLIFMVVGGGLYFRPFMDTIDAINTAGGLAASKAVVVAGQTQTTAAHLGQTLANAKEVDSKAIAIGLHGVDCLNGSLTGGKACAK